MVPLKSVTLAPVLSALYIMSQLKGQYISHVLLKLIIFDSFRTDQFPNLVTYPVFFSSPSNQK